MNTNKLYFSLKNLNKQNLDEKSSNSLPKNFFTTKETILNKTTNYDKKQGLNKNFQFQNKDKKISEDKTDSKFFENVDGRLGDISDFSATSSLESIPSTIGILERLIRTHPIWLLTNLERATTTYLLQGREEGSFIVRGSSKPGTLALSVRLPENKGPYIEHYLIENFGNRKLHLEGSEHYFSVIPMLICHYCQCCDELPVCLKLPDVVLTSNRNQLNSLSLLGDKFWTTNIEEYFISKIKNTSKKSKLTDLSEKSNDVSITTHSNLNYNKNYASSSNSTMNSSKSSFKSSDLDSESDELNNELKKKNICHDEIEESENQNKSLNKKKLKLNDKNEIDFQKNINLKESCPERPPRNIFHKFNVSPPPVPPRNSKPPSKNYFKISTVKTNKHDDKKDERLSNINLLINFDVFEEEERLINQLKEENDIIDLNEINAQTQHHFNSSHIDNKHSLIKDSDKISSLKNKTEVLINTSINVTKIENINETKIENTNETKIKFNGNYKYEVDNRDSESVCSETTKVKNLYLKEEKEEDEEEKEEEKEELVEEDEEEKVKKEENGENNKIEKLNNIIIKNEEKLSDYEDVWLCKPKQTNECEIQTEPQYFLNSSKWEKYRNFLVYDYAPANLKNNLTSTDGKCKDSDLFSFYYEPLDSINEQILSKKSTNISNPNLYCKNNLTKNGDYHSFESLIYKQCDGYHVKNNFFQRYIVPKNEKVSDVCLQVGDGLIKEEIEIQLNNLTNVNHNLNEENLTSSKRAEITTNGGKDLAWQLDSSWEWQNSDDEEPSIIKSQKKKLTGNTISAKYKRFSYKYVNESGVESENDYIINTDLIHENSLQEEEIINKTSLKLHATPAKLKSEDYDNLLNNNTVIDKNNVNELKIKTTLIQHQASSLNYWQKSNSTSQKKNELSLKCNGEKKLYVTNFKEGALDIIENAILSLSRNKDDEQPILDDEDEQEMVFEEIGLEDVYTTNDELDEDSRQNLIEDPYFLQNINFITSTVGKNISEYVFKLFTDNDNVFSKSIKNFIQCTKESNESNPLIVMRNIRQFMNGIKNYLIRNGEKRFLDLVKQEKKKLKQNEFLNLEAIIEGALHKLIIKPLKELIYKLFIKKEYKFGYESFLKITENINYLRGKKLEEFGLPQNLKLPNSYSMKKLENNFIKLQNSYSPLKKIEYLLSIASIINNETKINTSSNLHQSESSNNKLNEKIDEKDFVQLFNYFLVKFNFINMEIEAEYIWSLLQPSLLNGEAIYYLTVFSCCVYVLKSNFQIIYSTNDQLLNKIEIDLDMLISLLPPLNETSVAKCKLNLFSNNTLTNSLLSKVVNHSDLFNTSKIYQSRKKKFISKTSSYPIDNSFVPCALFINNLNNNNVQTSNNFNSFRFRSNELTPRLKLNSIFTICCLKILLLDEFTGNIKQKLLSVKPEMNTKEFCKLISQKFVILNAQDYSLFLLNEEGFEYLINENEVPFSIKINSLQNAINLVFVYKRTDSQYVWPKFTPIDFCQYS